MHKSYNKINIIFFILIINSLITSNSYGQFDFNSNYLNRFTNFKLNSNILLRDTLVILPLGNSITFDKRTNDPRVDEDKYGYRLKLANLLENAGITFDYIGSQKSGSNFLFDGKDHNAGFPGIKDDQLYTLLETGWRIQPPSLSQQITSGPYLETYTPDIILLHIGTNGNDLAGGTSAADIENILDEVDRIENLLNKEIFVFVARIIDRVPQKPYVNELNNNIDSMVTDRISNPLNPAYPDNLLMVDLEDSAEIIYAIDSMGTVGNGIIGDMNDLLHPNNKGFEKIGQKLFESITNTFQNPISIVKHPYSNGTIEGLSATFSISVDSDQPVSYQWIKDGLIIPGANDSIYIDEFLSVDDNDSKIVCQVKSGFYSVLSDTATLIVTDSNSRVIQGLIADYNFEEGKGDSIYNQINEFAELDLIINDSAAVDWIPYGLKVEGNPNIYSLNPARKVFDRVIKTNELSLEAWIKPENIIQDGPARILTISDGISNRNFTFGQIEDRFEFRLRTTETNENGKPSIITTSNSVSTSLTHIFYSRKQNGEVNIYINGTLDTNTIITGDLSNWDSTYAIGLSDEFLDDRLWLGKFYSLSIYDRALSNEEIFNNYSKSFNGANNLIEKPTNLTALIQNGTDVLLNWDDNSDEELGYIVERKFNDSDSLFIILDTVNVNVSTFIDSVIKIDSSYIYRLRAFNESYYSDYSDEIVVNDIPVAVDKENQLVNEFRLYQNYPNPFNPSTILKFSISKKSEVDLRIFNAIGEIVRVIYGGKVMSNGIYSEVFNGSGLASGVYFYRIIAKPTDGSATFIKINKALLIK